MASVESLSYVERVESFEMIYSTTNVYASYTYASLINHLKKNMASVESHSYVDRVEIF